MADWFTKLMHGGHARGHSAITRAESSKARKHADARDARYDAIVRMLRARELDDRDAREKRQRWYKQSLDGDSPHENTTVAVTPPTRLSRFRTKVPCRITAEARALLDDLRKHSGGATVSFPPVTTSRQPVMLTKRAGAEPKQIGWIEHCVETDQKLCNVRHHGLSVETDGGTMLVLRFRYPSTSVRMSSRSEIDGDDIASVRFTEIRPALELQSSSDKSSSPRLVWVTRPEAETMNALRSRDYEAFYVRFKLEVQAGIWGALIGSLSSAPTFEWRDGSCYTLVRELDAANRRIHERAIDDSGRAADIDPDRTYDAAPATDILLLFLDGDLLADFADIYFTLQALSSADAYTLKEEFFTVIRRFWSSAQSLASRYGSDLPTVIRMAQRAVPMPAQSPLLKQDWSNLRQSLVDRYGEGGRKAADLASQNLYRPRTGSSGWPFACFPAGEINVGLRLVYRQEWRHLGAQRGGVVRTEPPGLTNLDGRTTLISAERNVETTIEPGTDARNLDQVVAHVVRATVDAMQWPLELEGNVNTGVRALASRTDKGLEAECRESSEDTSARLSDIVQRLTLSARAKRGVCLNVATATPDDEPTLETEGITRVYNRLQQRYEVLTRPAEIQNVVMVAEKLPAPAEIDLAWVRRHDWILAKALLDESFRDAIESISAEASTEDEIASLAAKRDRLFQHLRANVLHYQRAIWRREDPHQRSMRYRKAGKKVPLDWRFELESGSALTIDELGDRLAMPNVDGQFAAYSGGRDVELEQLIDPAGPIGFYANYAIYHMRAEFGGDDLFSMLHFFKSPYLRPNPQSGEAEVDDPTQIQIAADPMVAGASDQIIEQHRDDMFEHVPALRRELAQARKNVADGTDLWALLRLERKPEALRRHFATYMFRRERSKRFELDTNGLVIDTIRECDVARGEREPAPQGHQVILEQGHGIEFLSAQRGRESVAEWQIHQSGRREQGLLAGRTRDPEAARVTLNSADRALRLNSAVAMAEQDVNAARVEADASGFVVGNGAGHGSEPSILAESDQVAAAKLRAGRLLQPASEASIIGRSDDARARSLIAGCALGLGDSSPIVAPRHEGATPNSVAGVGVAPPRKRVILAGAEGAQQPALRVGRAHDPRIEPAVVRPSADRRIGRILFGRAQNTDAERVILPTWQRGVINTATPGAEAQHPHDRVIVAQEIEWLRPSLVAD